MRTIERTARFKRDYKREIKGRHGRILKEQLNAVLVKLAAGQELEPRHRDHQLSGDWADHRDCHIKPDLILIYRRPDEETLQLVRLGSHSELGL